MSTSTLAWAGAALLLLTGCASQGGESATTGVYGGRYARLQTQCQERQGILQPTGVNRGDPATDYACVISNPTTDVLRR